MIKIYGTHSCPDCSFVEEQIQGDARYEYIEIGDHILHLKAFLKLRDTAPAFEAAKRMGAAGVPCFVLEDGTVTLRPEEAGLKARPRAGAACSIDGSGC